MKRIALAAAIAAFAAVIFVAPAQAAIAPGCTFARPSFIGGTLVGVDGRALDAHMGVAAGYRDSAGRFHPLKPDGSPADPAMGGYSWIERLNPTLPATGGDVGDRTWGMCVARALRTFYAEAYPKDPVDATHDPVHQVTNKERYGSSAYYAGTVTVGQKGDTLVRLPTTYQANGGNTGGLQGYITYRGHPVPTISITRVRAFPGPGAPCGIEGFSAAADRLATGATGRTYYKMDYLAGGRCGATYQGYSFRVTCHSVCGGGDKVYTRAISITRARWPRIDVAFT
jgi:hypothetical protein